MAERRVLFSISTPQDSLFGKHSSTKSSAGFKPASMHRVYKENTWAPAPKADVDRLAGETDYVWSPGGLRILHFPPPCATQSTYQRTAARSTLRLQPFRACRACAGKGLGMSDLRIYVFRSTNRAKRLRRRKQEKP